MQQRMQKSKTRLKGFMSSIYGIGTVCYGIYWISAVNGRIAADPDPSTGRPIKAD
jgi:hypothetical protein